MQVGAVSSVQEETGNEDLNGHCENGSESWDSYLGMDGTRDQDSMLCKKNFVYISMF